MNGLNTILGCATPAASTNNDDGAALVLFNYGFESGSVAGEGGSNTLYLYSIGSVTTAFSRMRGPYVISESYVTLSAGDTVSFNWKAENKPYSFYVDENFEIYAYLLDECDCRTIRIAEASGISAPWTRSEYTIKPTEAGTYRFVFVAGSRDVTGGRAVGSQVYIDNVKITKA
jgi:hypothetical protein